MLKFFVMIPYLTDQQRSDYKQMHKRCKKKHFADRIKSILALDRGHSFEEIAQWLMIDDTSVRRWHEQFLEGGIEALLKDDYQGSESKISMQEQKELVMHLEQYTYLSAKEIAHYVKEHFEEEYTTKGMTALLHRLGFSYKKPKHTPSKADPIAQEEFIKQYERLKQNKEAEDTIHFMDGVHPLHNSQPAYGWIKKGTEKELKANTGRERININGAYDIENHTLVFHEDESVNAQSTIALFDKMQANQAEGKINIIADNARYYRSKLVSQYLENNTRIQLIFLPPYSPNLNLIERLWRFFKRKITYNKYYERFALFKEKCLEFLQQLHIYKEELIKTMTEKFHLFHT